ncbi:MAG: OmcA/MtrC family decaheme c-type cytochrome [Pseudomonadota bacterium]|nr:MAG: OmcA/MtrC family decaheme c-type cytochrome [Pseudomonadota bacterium]
MSGRGQTSRWQYLLATITVIGVALAGCNGDDGAQGAPGAPGLPPPSEATALNFTITGVTVASPPVVNFSVTNQNGTPVAGLTLGDLRFTFAKLTPGSNGGPSAWQSYINTTATGAVGTPGAGNTAIQATREGGTTGAFVGTLVDNKDGTYSYTFKTDVTNVTSPIAVSYDATLTHRVGVQTRGALPAANALYTFRPSDGATTGIFSREIVKTSNCNECHDRIEAHDARIETKYCVTCHNPGSSDPDSGNTVDFKVMIHKIHRGANLPTVGGCNRPGCVVTGGGDYAIYGYGGTIHSFKDVHLPQDIRNCVKCHDGADSDTPQGANWNTAPSIAACGSCHEQTKFDEAPGTTPNSHPGGIVTDAQCLTCHVDTNVAGSPAKTHRIFENLAGDKFQFNIVSVCGQAPGSNPQCGNPATAVVVLSVTDPTGATNHGYGNAYNIKSDPEFTASAASFNLLTAWNTSDYTNDGGSGTRPARANSFNLKSTALGPNYVDNGNGTYTVTVALPIGVPPAAAPTGSGTVALEGHPAGPDAQGALTVSARVKGVTAAFGITDNPAKPRRVAVNIITNCDRCHDLLSVHGNNRSDDAQLCVTCHNPRNTDIARRSGVGIDGKTEESIDFKRLIHGIHAAAKTNFDGTTAHGFREKGLVIYGYGGTPHDYSHLRFPGVLSRCTTCHLDGAYQLTGKWEQPTLNGILGSTINTGVVADQSDDLVISPTAAVCSACHDSALAQSHMTLNGAQFGVLQSAITATGETCAICHGPGKIASVDFVHSEEFGEDIP